MEFKTTRSAEKLRSATVTFVDVPTNGAFLRGKPSIYKDHLFTKILRLVSDKLLQFKERPVVQFPVELRATTFLHSDLREILKCKHGIRRLNNLLRDAVINISHKPTFSSTHPLEFSAGGSRAFRLQFSSEIREFSPCIPHSRRIEKRVIGTHCNVHNTPVNTENFLIFNEIGSSGLNLTMQVESAIIPVERQSRLFDLPRQVLPVISRDGKSCFDPSVGAGDSGVSGVKTNPDHSLVVPHSRELISERFDVTFHRFQRFTRNISCSLYQRGREIRNRLSNILIGCLVTVNLAGRMVLKTPFSTGVERHSVISHGLQERVTTIRRNIKFQLDCPNHNHICTLLGYLSFGGDADALLPDLKFGVSALHFR